VTKKQSGDEMDSGCFYDLSLRLSFLLYFWNKLAENNMFDVKTVRKFLILREKINIQFLVATT